MPRSPAYIAALVNDLLATPAVTVVSLSIGTEWAQIFSKGNQVNADMIPIAPRGLMFGILFYADEDPWVSRKDAGLGDLPGPFERLSFAAGPGEYKMTGPPTATYSNI